MPFSHPCCYEPQRVLPSRRSVCSAWRQCLSFPRLHLGYQADQRDKPEAAPSCVPACLAEGGHRAPCRAAGGSAAADLGSRSVLQTLPPAPPGPLGSGHFLSRWRSPESAAGQHACRAVTLPGCPGAKLRCLPLLRVIQLQAAAESPLKRPPSEHLLVPLAPRPAVGSACGQALLGPSVSSFIRPQPLPSSLAWVAARNTEILCIPGC